MLALDELAMAVEGGRVDLWGPILCSTSVCLRRPLLDLSVLADGVDAGPRLSLLAGDADREHGGEEADPGEPVVDCLFGQLGGRTLRTIHPPWAVCTPSLLQLLNQRKGSIVWNPLGQIQRPPVQGKYL